MPITAYRRSPVEWIEQECSQCHTRRRVEVSSLTLGVRRLDGTGNAGVIMLPPCSCGAQEGVYRMPAQDFRGRDRASLHGLVVLALGERLVQLGRVAPECAAEVAAERRLPLRLVPLNVPTPT